MSKGNDKGKGKLIKYVKPPSDNPTPKEILAKFDPTEIKEILIIAEDNEGRIVTAWSGIPSRVKAQGYCFYLATELQDAEGLFEEGA